MVKIVDYKTYQNEDGEDFFVLIVQGGLEAVKSKETGQAYFTAKTANVTCTFNEITCKSLIGMEIPGAIKKVEVEPYEVIDSHTGEVAVYSERNVFVAEENETTIPSSETILKKNVELEENVI